jgi:hypothetical protein
MDLCNGDMELKEIQTLEGHTDRVCSLVWNPATGTSNIPPVFAWVAVIWLIQSGADSFQSPLALQGFLFYFLFLFFLI